MADDEKSVKNTRSSYEFIPKLKDKKITIRLVSDGQPVTGTLEGYNPYELLLPDGKGAAAGLQARYCHNRGNNQIACEYILG